MKDADCFLERLPLWGWERPQEKQDRQQLGQGNVNYIYSSFEEHKVTFIVFADEQRGFIVYPGQSMLCF